MTEPQPCPNGCGDFTDLASHVCWPTTKPTEDPF